MKQKIGWFLYVVVLAGVAVPLLWALGVFLPSGNDRSETVSFADDTAVSLTLAHGHFTASGENASAWKSDPGWRVQDYLTMDIDRDGATELLLLVWRRGNYGPSKPFWVKRNNTEWSQHIFIYNWQDGAPVPQWMSSGLRPQVSRWAAQPDGQLYILTPQGEETLWRWGQWGLVRTDL